MGLAEWIGEVWPDRKNGISDPENRQSLNKIYMVMEGAPDSGMTGKLQWRLKTLSCCSEIAEQRGRERKVGIRKIALQRCTSRCEPRPCYFSNLDMRRSKAPTRLLARGTTQAFLPITCGISVFSGQCS